ncbi:hypothetical protein [Loktanella salsilacus]
MAALRKIHGVAAAAPRLTKVAAAILAAATCLPLLIYMLLT